MAEQSDNNGGHAMDELAEQYEAGHRAAESDMMPLLAAKDAEIEKLRAENIQLRGNWCGAHALALLVLQSKCYHDPEIRDAVDTVLALDWDEHKSCPDCAAKDAEIDWLMDEYREAIRIIKHGKAQFAPDTTNSDADVFLSRAALKEADNG